MAKHYSERKPPVKAVVPITGIAAAAITAALLFTGGQEVLAPKPAGATSAPDMHSTVGTTHVAVAADQPMSTMAQDAYFTSSVVQATPATSAEATTLAATSQASTPLITTPVAYALDGTQEESEPPITPVDLSGAVAGLDYQDDVVLVSVDENKSADQIAQELAASGVETIDPNSVKIVADGVAQVSVNSGSSVEEALGELGTTDAAESAQPNYLYRIDEERDPEDLITFIACQSEVTIEQPQIEIPVNVTVSEQQAEQEVLTTQQEAPADVETTTNLEIQEESPQETAAGQEGYAGQSESVAQYEQPTVQYEQPTAQYEQPAVTTEPSLTQGTQGQESVTVQTPDVQVFETTVQGVASPVVENAPQQAQDNSGSTQTPEVPIGNPTSAIVNDPYVGDQWALESTRALDAWAQGYRTDRNVAVAVLDTGFEVNHEDLVDNIIPGSAYNAFDQNSDVSNYTMDGDGMQGNHGMHVTGIIGAAANNAKGVAGVSYNAKIVPIRVYNHETGAQSGTDTITLTRAFDYVRKNSNRYNIRVINLSMGLSAPLTADSVLSKMIDDAFNEGIVTVCSAGNVGSTSTNIPSDYPTAVGVINLRQTSPGSDTVVRADRSNYNAPGVMLKDISAPGTLIVSTWHENGEAPYSNVHYNYDSGTSMAAPHVSAALAILFAQNNFSRDAAGAQRAVDIICSSARSVDGSSFADEYGFGEVDILAANQKSNAVISGPTYMATGSQVTFTGGTNFVSSNESVLSITSSGVATAKGSGNVVITAMNGSTSMRKAVYVIGDIMIDKDASTYSLSTNKDVSLSVDEPAVFRWEWSVEPNDTLANVTDETSGILKTGSKAGTATIRATLLTPQPSAYSVVLTKTISIGSTKTNINQATVSFPSTTYYNGSAQTPKPTVTYGGSALVEGTDYEIGTYSNNINAGTASVPITGKGSFIGTKTATFTINRINISSATVDGVNSSYNYTGRAITPKPTVKLSGKTLTEGTDYSLTYANNTNAGTATITITGTGNYTGTTTKTFQIVRPDTPAKSIAGATVTVTPDSYTYTGSEFKPKPKVTLDGKTLTEGTDYTVSYKNNVNVGTATVTVTGIGNYTGSVSDTFTINRASVSNATITTADQTYTGSAITPTPTVKMGTHTLVEGTDFTVKGYENNTEVGEAKVTIAGKGNYTGEETGTFRIVSAEMPSVKDATVTLSSESFTYTGKEITPKPTVKLGEKTLNEGTDYTLSYKDNVNVGTATITVIGKGDYTGTTTCQFKIAEAKPKSTNIRDSSIEIPAATYVYTGSAIEPKPTVKIDDVTLKAGTDYTLSYMNNVNTGLATVTVIGAGDYTGSKSETFIISPASISRAAVSDLRSTYDYTGSRIEPKPTLSYRGKVLREGADYTVSYANNTEEGKASLTVTGIGSNWNGTKTVNFYIVKPSTAKSISGATFSSIPNQTYTGSAITPKPTVTLDGVTLTLDTDYTLSYSNNVNVGKATITARGIGNYKGSASTTFTIVEKSSSTSTTTDLSNFVDTADTWSARGVTRGTKYYFDPFSGGAPFRSVPIYPYSGYAYSGYGYHPGYTNSFGRLYSRFNTRIAHLPLLLRMRLGMGIPYNIQDLYYNLYEQMGLRSSRHYRSLNARLPYSYSMAGLNVQRTDDGYYYIKF